MKKSTSNSRSNEKIEFNFDTLKFENITIDDVKWWESVYPDVDVVEVLTKRMPDWLLSNPAKAHKKNWRRFITNWLARQQDRYGQFKR